MLKLLIVFLICVFSGLVVSDEICGDKICENGGVCRANVCYCADDYEGITCSKKTLTTSALIAIIVTSVLLVVLVILVIVIIKKRRARAEAPLIQKKSRRSQRSEEFEEEEPRNYIAEADIRENLRRHSQNQAHGIQTITQAATEPYPSQPIQRLSQAPQPSIREEQPSVQPSSHLANGTTVTEIPLQRESSVTQPKTPMDVIRRDRPVPKTRLAVDDTSTIASSVKIHSAEPLAPVNYLTPRSTMSTSSSTDRFSNGASFWYPAYLGGPTSGMGGGSFMMMGSNNSLTKVPGRK